MKFVDNKGIEFMKQVLAAKKLKKCIFAAVISLAALTKLVICPSSAYAGGDERRFAHGMSYVYNPVNDKAFLIWSDNYDGDPEANAWEHDIYYKEITGNISEADINTGKQALIRANEAQEPVSASAAGDGRIIVTFEDGNTSPEHELSQRYAVYDENMQAIKAYPQTIADGGHSGHAASTDNRHMVFWGEGWIAEGGVDSLGYGDDVWITVLDTNGNILNKRSVAVGEKTADWWPLIATSHNRALLLWQRYVPGKNYAVLCMAVYDPEKNDFAGVNGKVTGNTKPHPIQGAEADYYNYNVIWSEALKIFIVNYTDKSGNGRILLIDENGIIKKRVGEQKNLPSFVRESTPICRQSNKAAELIYPSSESEHFRILIKKEKTKSSKQEKLIIKISAEKELTEWSYRGTSGIYPAGESGFFVYPDVDAIKAVKSGW